MPKGAELQIEEEPEAQQVLPKASALADALLPAVGVRGIPIHYCHLSLLSLGHVLLSGAEVVSSLLLPLVPTLTYVHHSFIPNRLQSIY